MEALRSPLSSRAADLPVTVKSGMNSIREVVISTITANGSATVPFVIPRACDLFDLFVPFAHLTRFSTAPQNRHPERSASQIRRIKKGLGRGVEGPRRCLLADALLSFPSTN